jgi:release factor glutamine methyltransferase
MVTVAERLAAAVEALTPVTDTPRLDAELLLAHTLGTTRALLLTRLREPFHAPEFGDLLSRRLNHEPLAYIFGEWEFFSLPFYCEAPFLVPRPETEHLVETVLTHIGDAPAKVLDLCTGTGCVAVSVAKNAPAAHVDAVDIHPGAVALTQKNATRHNVSDCVWVGEGNLVSGLDPAHQYDAISANPPYVADGDWEALPQVIQRHEDKGALLAGADGLDIVRRIVTDARDYLHPGGMLALEIGDDQAEAVCELLVQAKFRAVDSVDDLAGIPRIVHGLWAP